MSINELQDEVIAEFSDFDDWMDRYQLLIDLGNEQEPLRKSSCLGTCHITTKSIRPNRI